MPREVVNLSARGGTCPPVAERKNIKKMASSKQLIGRIFAVFLVERFLIL